MTQPGAHRPPAARLHGLDALRGFAAVWVLLYHDLLRFPRFMAGQQMDPPLLAAVPSFRQAELGIMPVLWFFIISGFVIALTVDRCRTPWDFVVRRASRIYPAYWATVLLLAAITATAPLPGGTLTAPQVLANMTMAQSYLGVPDLDGAFWSLAVELLFYCYALSAFVLGRRHVHVVVLVWAVAGLVAAAAVRMGQPVSWQLSRLLLLTYGPLLAGGMMLYRLWQGQHRTWSAATLAVCAAAVVARFHPITAASCILAALAVTWSTSPGLLHRMAWRTARPLLALGSISYALYLSHQTVSFTVMAALDCAGLPHPAGIAAAILASLLVASAITYAVERPEMAVVRTWWRGSGATPAHQSGASNPR